ncbi:glycosyltransferase family 2 protein [Acinetobacter sp. CUI P1]|nr:glycosyltransferase family 2 protein [Acinetobacter sp. CUI P1]
MMGIKVSFIVPVYNVERYLVKCIESVLFQDYENIELLLINDGSNDQSPLICEEYSKKDNRVKLIHKENGGPSSARNLGLNHATGEYICFLDSDDFWFENKLNSIIIQLNDTKPDLLILPIVSYYQDLDVYSEFSKPINYQINSNKSTDNLILQLKNDYTFGWSPFRYIINIKIIKDNKLSYLEGVLCEDVDFVFRLWNNAKTVSYFYENVYVYRRDNSDSITHLASFKFSNDLLFVVKRILSEFGDYKIEGELKNLLYLNFQYLIGVVLYWYSSYTKNQRKILVKEILEIKQVFNLDGEFKNYGSKKTGTVKRLIGIFGINVTGILWGVRRNLRNHGINKTSI